MRYFPKTFSFEETSELYNSIKSEFRECGFGLYAVEVKESKEFIGFIGFHRPVFEADFTQDSPLSRHFYIISVNQIMIERSKKTSL